MNNKLLLLGYFVLITTQFAPVQSNAAPQLSLIGNLLGNTVSKLNGLVGGVVTDTLSILQNSVTKALCNLRTVNVFPIFRNYLLIFSLNFRMNLLNTMDMMYKFTK